MSHINRGDQVSTNKWTIFINDLINIKYKETFININLNNKEIIKYKGNYSIIN